ncbi:hypothetical protein PF006_g27577 [Phytophthora fragariae]|uniref:Secreted protein n=1 Tax=Phytophthora fragariae TaxID=53985 RepID=A0A6A3QM51_9STRA|nr:hypothetical protein PF006_g27577 [Phytophthora fragariae]
MSWSSHSWWALILRHRSAWYSSGPIGSPCSGCSRVRLRVTATMILAAVDNGADSGPGRMPVGVSTGTPSWREASWVFSSTITSGFTSFSRILDTCTRCFSSSGSSVCQDVPNANVLEVR